MLERHFNLLYKHSGAPIGAPSTTGFTWLVVPGDRFSPRDRFSVFCAGNRAGPGPLDIVVEHSPDSKEFTTFAAFATLSLAGTFAVSSLPLVGVTYLWPFVRIKATQGGGNTFTQLGVLLASSAPFRIWRHFP